MNFQEYKYVMPDREMQSLSGWQKKQDGLMTMNLELPGLNVSDDLEVVSGHLLQRLMDIHRELREQADSVGLFIYDFADPNEDVLAQKKILHDILAAKGRIQPVNNQLLSWLGEHHVNDEDAQKLFERVNNEHQTVVAILTPEEQMLIDLLTTFESVRRQMKMLFSNRHFLERKVVQQEMEKETPLELQHTMSGHSDGTHLEHASYLPASEFEDTALPSSGHLPRSKRSNK